MARELDVLADLFGDLRGTVGLLSEFLEEAADTDDHREGLAEFSLEQWKKLLGLPSSISDEEWAERKAMMLKSSAKYDKVAMTLGVLLMNRIFLGGKKYEVLKPIAEKLVAAEMAAIERLTQAGKIADYGSISREVLSPTQPPSKPLSIAEQFEALTAVPPPPPMPTEPAIPPPSARVSRLKPRS